MTQKNWREFLVDIFDDTNIDIDKKDLYKLSKMITEAQNVIDPKMRKLSDAIDKLEKKLRWYETTSFCPICLESGYIFRTETTCYNCNGKGRL